MPNVTSASPKLWFVLVWFEMQNTALKSCIKHIFMWGKKKQHPSFETKPQSRAATVISGPSRLIGMPQINSVSSKAGVYWMAIANRPVDHTPFQNTELTNIS